jgi:RNA polymerase sigma factor for flagellar operon FliA
MPPTATEPSTKSRSADDSLVGLVWDAFRANPTAEMRNLLVEHYQAYLRDLVRRFAVRLPRAIDRGDLSTAANVGLIAAISGYDPARGVPFEAYCELRVRGALLDELRSEDWLTRPMRARLELHKRVLAGLRSQLGREARDDEVAGEMGMKLLDYETLFGSALPGMPTRASAAANDDDWGRLDVVVDSRQASPDEALTRDELLQLVAHRLTELEARVVYLRYWENLPLREIGQLLHLSESRISKVHARLISRLQERLHGA